MIITRYEGHNGVMVLRLTVTILALLRLTVTRNIFTVTFFKPLSLKICQFWHPRPTFLAVLRQSVDLTETLFLKQIEKPWYERGVWRKTRRSRVSLPNSWVLLPLPKCFTTEHITVKAFPLFYSKESVLFPTQYFLFSKKLYFLSDQQFRQHAPYSHKARYNWANQNPC